MGLDRLIRDLRDKGVHIPKLLDDHPGLTSDSEEPASFQFPVSREYEIAAATYGWDNPSSADLVSVIAKSPRRPSRARVMACSR